MNHFARRNGFSYLELQIALVLFAVAISGLVPLSVMNTRQISSVGERFPADETHYLVRSERPWSARLGTPAKLSSSPPSPSDPSVELIDDGDADFDLIDFGTWDWYTYSSSLAYQSDYRKNNGGNLGDAGEWTFENLAPGKYEIFVTYPHLGSNATDSPYRVYDDTAYLGIVRVNQKTPPSGSSYGGASWDSLGQFVNSSGTIRVTLSDDANGDIAADAVRFVPIRNELEILTAASDAAAETFTVDVLVTAP